MSTIDWASASISRNYRTGLFEITIPVDVRGWSAVLIDAEEILALDGVTDVNISYATDPHASSEITVTCVRDFPGSRDADDLARAVRRAVATGRRRGAEEDKHGDRTREWFKQFKVEAADESARFD